MQLFIALRGKPKLVRRVIEDLQDIWYSYFNRKTGKKIGMLQLVPREVKLYELAFPETAKINIKTDVRKIIRKHSPQTGGVSIHFGLFKKDKYNKDGSERI